jgi:hypothetical protein
MVGNLSYVKRLSRPNHVCKAGLRYCSQTLVRLVDSEKELVLCVTYL